MVWNMNFMTFHSVGNSNPNWWTHIFQRGRYTTNHISTVLSLIYLFRCANSRLATLEALAIFEWREYLVQMPLGSSVIVKKKGDFMGYFPLDMSWDMLYVYCTYVYIKMYRGPYSCRSYTSFRHGFGPLVSMTDWWFRTFYCNTFFPSYWEYSSQLTNSIMFQRGRAQPPIR